MRLFVFLILIAAVLALFPAKEALADVPSTPAAALLPDRIEDFAALGAARPAKGFQTGEYYETAEATREYQSRTSQRLSITVVTTNSDSSAYALLTSLAHAYSGARAGTEGGRLKQGDVGTASYLFADSIFFFKGSTYVVVGQLGERGKHPEAMIALARGFAGLLDKGDGEIPSLVKHLPDWEAKLLDVGYAVNAKTLARVMGNQPVLDSIAFEGGTEAVAAGYGQSQLLLVEFTTPQLASENDRQIVEKIHELTNEGKPVPTAYRRVGNYSVFVFNAPDASAASQLIDQVKYEQVVRWLGDNPNLLKEAQRRYTETTLGVFIAVIKASALAAVACFGIGGVFGALLFVKRRAQQTELRAYSDAGGMMRLNIDEMTPKVDSSRLISSGMSDKI